ncbi:MAG TPA: phage tail protein, partial [Aquirhabdus sp.]
WSVRVGGSSKSQVVGYTYSLGAHFIFSAGEVDFVSAITFRDHETYAWKGNASSNTTLAINKPDLFGGQASQGGVVGNISLMFGAPSQTPNTYLVGLRGALVPAYRNVLGVTWEALNIGANPYVPTWGLEYSRIHKRWSLDGVNTRAQWYDVKAAIPFVGTTPVTEMFSKEHWDYKWYAEPVDAGNGDANKSIEIDLTGWTTNKNKVDVPFKSAVGDPLFPCGTSYFGATVETIMWYRWNFTPKKSKDIIIDVSSLFQFDVWLNGNKLDSFASGTKTIVIPKSKLIVGGNNVLAIRTSGGTPSIEPFYLYSLDSVQYGSLAGYPPDTQLTDTDYAIAYRDTIRLPPYSVPTAELSAINYVIDGTTGVSRVSQFLYSVPSGTHSGNFSRHFYEGSAAAPNTITFEIVYAANFDMNPIHWLRETYTEPWARRFSEALFPDPEWQAAADTVYNEGLGITTFYDGSSSLESHQAEVRRHIQCEVYKDRKDGKFKPKLIRNDYVVANLLLLNESNINDISDDGGQVFGQLTTSVTVSYTDTENGWIDGSVTVSDIALAQQQGKVIAVNLDYKMFTSQKVAARMAQTMLKTLSTPLKKYTIDAQRIAKDLNKGSVFKVSWAAWGVTEKVMRVTDVNYGNGLKNN